MNYNTLVYLKYEFIITKLNDSLCPYVQTIQVKYDKKMEYNAGIGFKRIK